MDGCDLTVMPGGHVAPEQSAVDLMRAIEAVTGVGLDVPVITTAYTSFADPTIRNVAAIAGEMGVPIFRAGQWKYPPAAESRRGLQEVQRDIAGLASLARAVNMALAIRNVPGDNVGAAIWDTNMLIRGMDPRTVGLRFRHRACGGGGRRRRMVVALRLALPRSRW